MYARVNFGDLVKLEYMPNANHILTDEKDQDAVINGVTDWIVSLH